MKKFACSEKNFTLATGRHKLLFWSPFPLSNGVSAANNEVPCGSSINAANFLWWVMTDPWTLCLCMVHQIFQSFVPHNCSRCISACRTMPLPICLVGSVSSSMVNCFKISKKDVDNDCFRWLSQVSTLQNRIPHSCRYHSHYHYPMCKEVQECLEQMDFRFTSRIK